MQHPASAAAVAAATAPTAAASASSTTAPTVIAHSVFVTNITDGRYGSACVAIVSGVDHAHQTVVVRVPWRPWFMIHYDRTRRLLVQLFGELDPASTGTKPLPPNVAARLRACLPRAVQEAGASFTVVAVHRKHLGQVTPDQRVQLWLKVCSPSLLALNALYAELRKARVVTDVNKWQPLLRCLSAVSHQARVGCWSHVRGCALRSTRSTRSHLLFCGVEDSTLAMAVMTNADAARSPWFVANPAAPGDTPVPGSGVHDGGSSTSPSESSDADTCGTDAAGGEGVDGGGGGGDGGDGGVGGGGGDGGADGGPPPPPASRKREHEQTQPIVHRLLPGPMTRSRAASVAETAVPNIPYIVVHWVCSHDADLLSEDSVLQAAWLLAGSTASERLEACTVSVVCLARVAGGVHQQIGAVQQQLAGFTASVATVDTEEALCASVAARIVDSRALFVFTLGAEVYANFAWSSRAQLWGCPDGPVCWGGEASPLFRSAAHLKLWSRVSRVRLSDELARVEHAAGADGGSGGVAGEDDDPAQPDDARTAGCVTVPLSLPVAKYVLRRPPQVNERMWAEVCEFNARSSVGKSAIVRRQCASYRNPLLDMGVVAAERDEPGHQTDYDAWGAASFHVVQNSKSRMPYGAALRIPGRNVVDLQRVVFEDHPNLLNTRPATLLEAYGAVAAGGPAEWADVAAACVALPYESGLAHVLAAHFVVHHRHIVPVAVRFGALMRCAPQLTYSNSIMAPVLSLLTQTAEEHAFVLHLGDEDAWTGKLHGGEVVDPPQDVDVGQVSSKYYMGLLDVASMYPSLIRGMNICWSTYDPRCTTEECQSEGSRRPQFLPVGSSHAGLLPLCVTRVVQARAAADARAAAGDRVAAAESKRFKQAANSFYGCLASSVFPIRAVFLAESITTAGRKLLRKMRDALLQQTAVRAGRGTAARAVQALEPSRRELLKLVLEATPVRAAASSDDDGGGMWRDVIRRVWHDGQVDAATREPRPYQPIVVVGGVTDSLRYIVPIVRLNTPQSRAVALAYNALLVRELQGLMNRELHLDDATVKLRIKSEGVAEGVLVCNRHAHVMRLYTDMGRLQDTDAVVKEVGVLFAARDAPAYLAGLVRAYARQLLEGRSKEELSASAAADLRRLVLREVPMPPGKLAEMCRVKPPMVSAAKVLRRLVTDLTATASTQDTADSSGRGCWYPTRRVILVAPTGSDTGFSTYGDTVAHADYLSVASGASGVGADATSLQSPPTSLFAAVTRGSGVMGGGGAAPSPVALVRRASVPSQAVPSTPVNDPGYGDSAGVGGIRTPPLAFGSPAHSQSPFSRGWKAGGRSDGATTTTVASGDSGARTTTVGTFEWGAVVSASAPAAPRAYAPSVLHLGAGGYSRRSSVAGSIASAVGSVHGGGDVQLLDWARLDKGQRVYMKLLQAAHGSFVPYDECVLVVKMQQQRGRTEDGNDAFEPVDPMALTLLCADAEVVADTTYYEREFLTMVHQLRLSVDVSQHRQERRTAFTQSKLAAYGIRVVSATGTVS